jgi:fatty acid/phospholipid biosynthesis enzyme
MKQLIYRSRPFGFDNATLASILMTARRNNRQSGVTGALICRQDMYLQLIEGPETAIDSLYAKIREDDRHLDVTLEASGAITQRMFPEWAMLDDTNPSMTFSAEEVEEGAADRASADAMRAIFRRIANKARSPGN